MTCRNSPSRRPFSGASFVGVPKIASNAVMREQRSWIFFLTATVSCRRVFRNIFERMVVNEPRISHKW